MQDFQVFSVVETIVTIARSQWSIGTIGYVYTPFDSLLCQVHYFAHVGFGYGSVQDKIPKSMLRQAGKSLFQTFVEPRPASELIMSLIRKVKRY
jgi:hypothetical protein